MKVDDITLYLDMDGVIANFSKEFSKYDANVDDKRKFAQAVMDDRIFEKLEMMPDAQELLNKVKHLHNSGMRVEMLTSMGTFDEVRGAEAKRQKLLWLKEHNINYPANFVRTKSEKADYAHSKAILIDDSSGCITPFIRKKGYGILHRESSTTNRILDVIIERIRMDDKK